MSFNYHLAVTLTFDPLNIFPPDHLLVDVNGCLQLENRSVWLSNLYMFIFLSAEVFKPMISFILFRNMMTRGFAAQPHKCF